MDFASRATERITLEQPVGADDGLGGQEITWEEVATLWAEVRPAGGAREGASAQQPEAAAGYRVRIRTRDGVNAAMRLQWRGRTLAVHSVHAHANELELLAYEEGV